MILAIYAQQLKGLRTCGDKDRSALEEFMLKDEGCLVFGHLNSRGKCQTEEYLYYLDFISTY